MKREIGDYIEDIIKAMNASMEFVNDISYDDFAEDNKTIYATIRALEVIGEAVKNIPDDVRKEYLEIPWKKMAGMRDKVIHEYFGVRLERVWETIQRDIPRLKPLFEKILKDIEK